MFASMIVTSHRSGYVGEEDFLLLADNVPAMIWRSGIDKLCD
jgi:hypothetical protein